MFSETISTRRGGIWADYTRTIRPDVKTPEGRPTVVAAVSGEGDCQGAAPVARSLYSMIPACFRVRRVFQ